MIYPHSSDSARIFGLLTNVNVLRKVGPGKRANADPALTINAIWSSR